ncbi:MAG: hypothetical protein ACPGWR_20980, partial [Ardenticatenaceae bacterium]
KSFWEAKVPLWEQIPEEPLLVLPVAADEQAGMRVLPDDEEILRDAQEGCVFYLTMKRSFVMLRRDACST